MVRSVGSRLRTLDTELPRPNEPGANYIPYLGLGDLLFLTGQLCHCNGERLFIGKLGAKISIEEGQKAARIFGKECLDSKPEDYE